MSKQTAEKAGIQVGELPAYPIPIRGFGGPVEAKHLSDPCRVFIEFDNHEMGEIYLPKGIGVYLPSKRGDEKGAEELTIDVLGRDAISASRWKFVIDGALNLAYLEMP